MQRIPIDAEVFYEPGFLSAEESKRTYDAIVGSCDLSDATMMVGDREYKLDVGKMMFVDPPLVDPALFPAFHGPRQPWTDEVAEVKAKVEAVAERAYGVCVAIFYKDGTRGMDFHSDLRAYGDVSSIASISLGASREFMFRRVEDHEDTYGMMLNDGDLVLMGRNCQDRYQHALLVDPHCTQPRLNLTFRIFDY